jgi:hypothetical protein
MSYLDNLISKFWFFVHFHKLRNLPEFSNVTIIARNENIGFFAFLNWYLYITKYLESLKLLPDIVLKNSNYASESKNYDILRDRLQPQKKYQLTTTKKLEITVRNLKQLVPAVSMSISEASSIQKRLLVPSKRIQDLVDAYIQAEIGEDFFAVHWRGTDKKGEAPPVSLEQIVCKIEQLLDNGLLKSTRCYIASDEESKVQELKSLIVERFMDIKVVYRPDTLRSLSTTPIHLGKTKSKYQSTRLGDEALFECLLLSRASCLIKTASFLSGWSAVFNPALPVYFLNTPYTDKTWFPESELIHRAEST